MCRSLPFETPGHATATAYPVVAGAELGPRNRAVRRLRCPPNATAVTPTTLGASPDVLNRDRQRRDTVARANE